ncbi:hypothetical protein BGX38DRAFT_1236244 [Terfezia claveryi]|nr:hypothetical protein BGX38DRAFT_1236244 [Terfezia claveryi]
MPEDHSQNSIPSHPPPRSVRIASSPRQGHPNVRQVVSQVYAGRDRPLIPYNLLGPFQGIRIRVDALQSFTSYHGPRSRRSSYSPARSASYSTPSPPARSASFSTPSPPPRPFSISPPSSGSLTTRPPLPSSSSSGGSRHREYPLVFYTPLHLAPPSSVRLQLHPSTSEASESPISVAAFARRTQVECADLPLLSFSQFMNAVAEGGVTAPVVCIQGRDSLRLGARASAVFSFVHVC